MIFIGGMLLGIMAWLCFALFHWLWWRWSTRGRADFIRLVICVMAGYGIAFFAFSHWVLDATLLFWMSAPFFALMIVAYGHFYAGILRSVSVRILEELEAENGFITWGELNRRCPSSNMFLERLELLLRTGYLHKHGGAYECSGKGVRVARIMIQLASIYRISAAG